MINKQWSYYAKFVKHPQGKYTSFAIGVKDIETGDWKNYNIFVLSNVDLKDGDKVKFTDIISVDQKVYNNKTQFHVTAEIEVIREDNQNGGYADDSYSYNDESNNSFGNDDEPILDITSDDLPF